MDLPAKYVLSASVFAFSSRQQLHQKSKERRRDTAKENTKLAVNDSTSPFCI